jgi:hypothetical protein
MAVNGLSWDACLLYAGWFAVAFPLPLLLVSFKEF